MSKPLTENVAAVLWGIGMVMLFIFMGVLFSEMEQRFDVLDEACVQVEG